MTTVQSVIEKKSMVNLVRKVDASNSTPPDFVRNFRSKRSRCLSRCARPFSLDSESDGLKHFLREEPGVYYQDLYPLVCFLPRYATHGTTPADMLPQNMLPLWQAVRPFLISELGLIEIIVVV
jgi:hypothetical protein